MRDINFRTVVDLMTGNPHPTKLQYMIMDLNSNDGIEISKAKLNQGTLSESDWVSLSIQAIDGFKFLVLEAAANLDA